MCAARLEDVQGNGVPMRMRGSCEGLAVMVEADCRAPWPWAGCVLATQLGDSGLDSGLGVPSWSSEAGAGYDPRGEARRWSR